MVQGERVVKAFLSKKIKKILKNEAKIKRFQFDLEKAYLDFDKRVTALEVKKGLKKEEVENARGAFSDLEHPKACGKLQGLTEASQKDLARRLLGGPSIVMGQQGPFSILTGQLFGGLKPPWV